MGSFHEMKIREISAGQDGNNEGYIELQMYSPGQNLVSGHNIFCYDAAGTLVDTKAISGTNPANSDSQRTVLIGDNGVSGRDLNFNPGANCMEPPAAAGAICFETIDCISWGAFTGAANLPDRTTPFPGVLPKTTALRRSIAPNCATLLEAADDTNNAATDFAGVARDPTPNSTLPLEKLCPANATGKRAAALKKCKKKKSKKARKKCRKRARKLPV